MQRRLEGKLAAMLTFSDYPADFRVRREAETLVRAGMQVDLICIRKDSKEARAETINNVRVLRLPINYGRSGKLDYVLCYSVFLVMAGCILAVRTLRKRYDLVHVHNMPDFLVFAGLVPRLCGAKLLLDLHDPMPELFETIYKVSGEHRLIQILRLQERLSLRFAHLALTPNIAFRDVFVARGCPPEKMQIVMNSPNQDIFREDLLRRQPEELPHSRAFRIMHHGSILERHGLDTAIRAIALAKGKIPNLQFEIYGRPTPYLNDVLSLARTLDLEACITYRGERTIEQIAALVASIDLGLVPNPRNPFTELNMPTRIFEYLALHKAVICPDTKGIRDYFGPEDMLFFNAGDPNSLAERIIWVAEHPEATRQLVERAHQVYLRHAWEGEERRFVGLIANLLLT